MADMQLNSIVKHYGDHQVLYDIDLTIPDGEFVVLVGPSGCGKSTLLRMIAGLDEISSGNLVIGGVRANDLPPQKRNIAMVFQSYALFPHMNVRENIAYGPKLRGEDPQVIDAAITRAAGILNLTPYLDRYPRQLSGGQRQRVAMGRAIVREPSLFLFDEPLSNLDAQLRVQMRTEIKALHRKVGRTTIYVTHDQIEAMTLADRIVIMNAGRIEQIGSPLDLYDKPASTFVATFIGSPSMNLLPAAMTNGRIVTETGETIAAPPGMSVAEGTSLLVGIRPEHFDVAADDQGLAMHVSIVEQTGADTYVYGDIGGTAVTVLFRSREAIRPDTSIRLAHQPGSLHLFDRKSGRRIEPA